MQHWNEYWQQSQALNSFAEGAAATGYAGAIAAFWQLHLNNLPEQAVIVDLGTGNGALAALLQQYSAQQGLEWQIHGVDAAAIDPQAALVSKPELAKQIAGIEFHGKTDICHLPFADGSVDALVSQFGFEYADREQALKEAERVLKPGGVLLTMMHHSDSPLSLDSARGVQIFDYVLHNTPLFIQADLLLRMTTNALKNMDIQTWKQTQDANAVSKSMEWTMHVINARYDLPTDYPWLSDIFQRIIGVINHGQDYSRGVEAQERLNIIYKMLNSHLHRLRDQKQATLNEEQLEIYTNTLTDWQDVEFSAFEINDEVFAWWFKAVR